MYMPYTYASYSAYGIASRNSTRIMNYPRVVAQGSLVPANRMSHVCIYIEREKVRERERTRENERKRERESE